MPNIDLYTKHFPYILNRVDKAFASKTGNQFSLSIYLDYNNSITSGAIWDPSNPNPWLASLLIRKNPGKHFFEGQINKVLQANKSRQRIATNEYPIRWAGSGGLLILVDSKGKQFVPLNIRPVDALYPNHLDANGGLSSTVADWLSPIRLGYRELFEELTIVLGSTLITPDINSDLESNLATKDIYTNSIKLKSKVIAENLIRSRLRFKMGKIKNITPPNSCSEITIHLDGKSYKSSSLVLFDYETAAIDTRYIFSLEIDSVDNLILIDSEENGRFKDQIRDRELYLFRLEDLLELNMDNTIIIKPSKQFKSGMSVKPIALQLSKNPGMGKYCITPVLRSMIESLREKV